MQKFEKVIVLFNPNYIVRQILKIVSLALWNYYVKRYIVCIYIVCFALEAIINSVLPIKLK